MVHTSTHSESNSSKTSLQLAGIIFLLLLAYCATAQNTLVGLTSNGSLDGKGTAFSITTSGNNFSVIKGFADWGKIPLGNLYKNDDGNFYGMTSGGGTFGYGSVFSMTPAGKVTIVRQLDFRTDGAYPNGDLIKGADGYLYGATLDGGTSGYGTIFKISTDGSSFTVLKHLTYADGVSVYGHLTMANDGNFYGITYRGGSTGAGTIFKLTSGGVFSVIHNMTSASEGSGSVSSLTEGKDGNLYGVTTSGGASSSGTIFRVTKAGALTVLKSFNGSSDGYFSSSDLLQATDNNFYGTCNSGGANSSGTIYKITTGGVYTVIKNFVYSSDGGNPKGGLFQNLDGNFYGITKAGGAKSGGTVYKLTSANVFSVIHALDYTTEGNSSTSDLIKGDDGKLYSMASDGGAYDMGTAFSVTTDGTLTVIADFNGAAIGNAPSASFTKGADSALYSTTSYGGQYGYGSIIKICGGVTTNVHSFKQTEGGNPLGKMILAKDGNFYGMTSTGGANSYGTIYKLTPGGNFQVFYSFKYPDGTKPQGNLIQAADGNLYGMTTYGGANGDGTIFKISLSAVLTVLKNFAYSTDGSKPYGSLIQANDGNFYGMTSNNPKLFMLTQTGTFTIVHAFTTADGNYPYGSLIQGADNNLYGTCSEGGSNSFGTVFQCSLAGTFKVIRNFVSSGSGQTPKGSLLQGPDGTLYGTTSKGGTYATGTLFKMQTSGANYTELKQLDIRKDGGTPLGDLIFAPVNNLVANAQAVTTNEDKKIAITLTGSGGSPLAYNIAASPLHGKLTGTGAKVTYTPTKNYNGKDSFSFTVSIGCIASAPAYVTITIKPVADTPVLAPIGNKTVVKNSTLTFTAKATDPDKGEKISYSLIGAPAGATINATTGVFTWKPTTAGSYTFKVRATDNSTLALYDEEQITVTVTNTLAAFSDDARNISVSKIDVSVYPNPVSDVLNVRIANNIENAVFNVVDINGRIIKSQKVNGPSKSIQINVKELATGLYHLQLTASNSLKQDINFIKK